MADETPPALSALDSIRELLSRNMISGSNPHGIFGPPSQAPAGLPGADIPGAPATGTENVPYSPIPAAFRAMLGMSPLQANQSADIANFAKSGSPTPAELLVAQNKGERNREPAAETTVPPFLKSATDEVGEVPTPHGAGLVAAPDRGPIDVEKKALEAPKSSIGSVTATGTPKGAPQVGATLAGDKTNDDRALATGLLSLGMNLLFRPSWGASDSIFSGLEGASQGAKNYYEQRSTDKAEADKSLKNKAEIEHLYAQSANQRAHAATAGLTAKAELELLKNKGNDKSNLDDAIRGLPAAFLAQAPKAASEPDIIEGRSSEQRLNESINTAKNLQKTIGEVTSSVKKTAAAQRAARGQLTLEEFTNLFPDRALAARNNPAFAEKLRKSFSGPELSAYERYLKTGN